MAYDPGLAERLHDYFADRPEVEVKRMFGGLCFMVAKHMCCGIIGEKLMARVGPEKYDEYLEHPHATEMDFTGKPMKGIIYVLPEGLESDEELEYWLNVCESFIRLLPPKW